ncbi:MAG: glutamate--tRNA ligase [Acidobacteria bacterium]|nr:glutamate--tRNA ligase [Acidobacteriota bacterium]
MRVRFAPSPTGHLHVGNARTALFNWLLARHHGGTYILRVEDTDRERSTVASEAAIKDDLRWLGLTWDEGIDATGDVGPYRQSERLDLYAAHTRDLVSRGHAYHCFCTPERLEAERQAALAAGAPPKYAGTCRALDPAVVARRMEAGEAPAVRLRVPPGRIVSFDDLVRGTVSFHTDVIGDPVIVRSDGIPAYNYAVVIDDALMRITHVVRGEDHISNTPRQMLIYEAFGWTPPAFAHLSLVLGPDHAPLSKRHGATSVAEFRGKGYLPEALANYLALLGWSPGEGQELLPLDQLAARFELAAVGHSAGVFDEAKLAWVNRHYLKLATPERLVSLSLPYLEAAGWITGQPSIALSTWLTLVVPPLATSIDKLSDLPDRLRLLFAWDPVAALAHPDLGAEVRDPLVLAVARAFAAALAEAPALTTKDSFRALAKQVSAATGAKGKSLFHTIRLVCTGEPDGPELDLLIPAIEQAARLAPADGLMPVMSCRARAAAFVAILDRTPV